MRQPGSEGRRRKRGVISKSKIGKRKGENGRAESRKGGREERANKLLARRKHNCFFTTVILACIDTLGNVDVSEFDTATAHFSSEVEQITVCCS